MKKRKWKRRGQYETVTEFIGNTVEASEEELLHPKTDPYIRNLDKAAAVIKECIGKSMPITIVGDYDCDGMMASSILKLFFEAEGIYPKVRLPRRFSEGYGLSEKIIDEIEFGLVITVDNGIRAKDAISKAKEKGLTVVVTDHHEGSMEGIPADVIVDPHAEEGVYSEHKDYCGAGLAYRLGKELFPNSRMDKKARVLSGIATVADVVPMLGDNRNLVCASLKYLNAGIVTKGLRLLLDALSKEHYDEVDYGFTIGPVMNASGRLLDDGPDDIVSLVTADTEIKRNPEIRKEKEELVQELIRRNEKRKQLVKQYLEDVHMIMQREGLEKDLFLVVHVPDCHEGIIGILAGRIAEEFQRPCIILTESSRQGFLKGSGRTAQMIHLKEKLDLCSGLLYKYGGHAGACGLTVREENVQEFKSRLNELMKQESVSLESPAHFYDLEITEKDIRNVLDEQETYAPFGERCRKPVVCIRGYEILPDKKTGEYVQLLGEAKSTIRFSGRRSTCIGFDMKGRYQEEGDPEVVDILGTLSWSYQNGRTFPQVEIIDIRKAQQNMNAETAALEQLFF